MYLCLSCNFCIHLVLKCTFDRAKMAKSGERQDQYFCKCAQYPLKPSNHKANDSFPNTDSIPVYHILFLQCRSELSATTQTRSWRSITHMRIFLDSLKCTRFCSYWSAYFKKIYQDLWKWWFWKKQV